VTTNPVGDIVFVEAPARLHFGVLDLRGSLGRWFGGIGAAVSSPALLVSAQRAGSLEVSGEDAARAACFARRFFSQSDRTPGVHLRVHSALPPHAGLGSGTQLALAVGRALAELFGVHVNATSLAGQLGRAQRSAVGTWTFEGGGFVLEGGVRPQVPGVAPLLARLPFPVSWRCVVAIPDAQQGLSGAMEGEAFAELPNPPEADVQHVSHLVLMSLLPALADADLVSFGRALSAIQLLTGRWFASVQGGAYAQGWSEEVVRRMTEWGAAGVGQSSWGPTVYGLVDGEDGGRRLAERVQTLLAGSGTQHAVYCGPFNNTGARVWRSPTSHSP